MNTVIHNENICDACRVLIQDGKKHLPRYLAGCCEHKFQPMCPNTFSVPITNCARLEGRGWLDTIRQKAIEAEHLRAEQTRIEASITPLSELDRLKHYLKGAEQELEAHKRVVSAKENDIAVAKLCIKEEERKAMLAEAQRRLAEEDNESGIRAMMESLRRG